jgi:hypothetical protein
VQCACSRPAGQSAVEARPRELATVQQPGRRLEEVLVELLGDLPSRDRPLERDSASGLDHRHVELGGVGRRELPPQHERVLRLLAGIEPDDDRLYGATPSGLRVTK